MLSGKHDDNAFMGPSQPMVCSSHCGSVDDGAAVMGGWYVWIPTGASRDPFQQQIHGPIEPLGAWGPVARKIFYTIFISGRTRTIISIRQYTPRIHRQTDEKVYEIK
jgi:hypothetical protein